MDNLDFTEVEEEKNDLDFSEIEEESQEIDFLNAEAEADEPTAEEEAEAQPFNLGLIDPEQATYLIDAVLTASIIFAVNRFMQKRLTRSQVAMSEKDKKFIAPLIGKCLRSINLNIENPWSALALGLGIVYGSKVVPAVLETKSFAPKESGSIEQTEAEPPKRGRGRPRKNSVAEQFKFD